MPRDALVALLNAADCYVSLHRSEGLGLGLAESMFLGKPVIGTAYSGNCQFMTEENSCLVRYALVPVNPDEYDYSGTNSFLWAEADVDHAAHLMRKVASDRQFRESIAGRASADIRARFDTHAIGQMMRARLAEIDAA
jgi:glycosyltransferase involved in cell wall biosynthesis